MIDIKFLRENPEVVKENIRKKFQDSKLPLVDEVIELDAESRKTQQEADDLRANRNKISKEIGALMAKGLKEEAEQKKAEVAAGAKRLVELEEKEKEIIKEMRRAAIPFVIAFNKCDLKPASGQDRAYCRENGLPEIGEEEAKAYIRYMYGLYQCGMWVVLEKESGRIIGRAGFGIADYLPEAELDLGYLIDTPYRRQGYGEEACRAALDYGRDWLELPEISAYAEAENTASCHLLEKLGFRREQEFFCKEQKMYRYRKDFGY